MSRKLRFVLADGGRVRFVERSASNGRFTTLEEIDRTAALRRLDDPQVAVGDQPERRAVR